MIGSLKTKLGRFLFREEGGKRVVHKRNAGILSCAAIMVGIAISLVPAMFTKEDTSQIRRSDVPIQGAQASAVPPALAQKSVVGGVADHPKDTHGGQARSQSHHIIVKYRAKQVIMPGDGADKISVGANFIGKLMTGIDTRAPQAIQAVLPYGTSDKNGTGNLPPQTILFGQVSYPGQGERVFVNFDHGVLPDGREIAIQARALSSKDYTPGIIGDFHGNKTGQMASVLGLTMVGGMSDVMVEKEGLGQTFEATPKATLKNGFYNGLSKVTEMEATHQAEKLGQLPEYVTVEEGSDLIISLTSSYHSSNERQQ